MGFAGRDCSFPIDICKADENNSGVRACYIGGKCFAEPDADGVSFHWKCNCSAAFGGPAQDNNNEQCSFSDQYLGCERGKTNSDYAFCVNGGTCGDNVVDSGEYFRGCTCPPSFEGRHCQFAAGAAPKQEMTLYPKSKAPGLGGKATAIIVLAAIAATAGLVL